MAADKDSLRLRQRCFLFRDCNFLIFERFCEFICGESYLQTKRLLAIWLKVFRYRILPNLLFKLVFIQLKQLLGVNQVLGRLPLWTLLHPRRKLLRKSSRLHQRLSLPLKLLPVILTCLSDRLKQVWFVGGGRADSLMLDTLLRAGLGNYVCACSRHG